jgi:hypothetical protein
LKTFSNSDKIEDERRNTIDPKNERNPALSSNMRDESDAFGYLWRVCSAQGAAEEIWFRAGAVGGGGQKVIE